MSLKQAMTTFIPQVEAELRRLMTPDGPLDAFYGMLHYHLGWLDEHFTAAVPAQGKMLRPLYTLVCCQAAGGNPTQAVTAAAAVELIHNFSLIHDDIEDRSRLRRGRRTVWDIWGEAQAINAGDTMFILARNSLLRLADQGVPLATILEAIERLDRTCLALCRGQFLDMGFETAETVDLAAYLEMIEGKTAHLLACAGYLGGLIATDDPLQAQPFWDLGIAAGLAFQIQDDWLGIWGQEAVTGKRAADDLRRHKKTLPVVFALNQTNHAGAAHFRTLYSAVEVSEEAVTEAVAILEEIGAKTYTENQAKEQIDRAETVLAKIETVPAARETLQEMARYFIQRVY